MLIVNSEPHTGLKIIMIMNSETCKYSDESNENGRSLEMLQPFDKEKVMCKDQTKFDLRVAIRHTKRKRPQKRDP